MHDFGVIAITKKPIDPLLQRSPLYSDPLSENPGSAPEYIWLIDMINPNH